MERALNPETLLNQWVLIYVLDLVSNDPINTAMGQELQSI